MESSAHHLCHLVRVKCRMSNSINYRQGVMCFPQVSLLSPNSVKQPEITKPRVSTHDAFKPEMGGEGG
eukprot:3279758-Amphidinium_carterae.3